MVACRHAHAPMLTATDLTSDMAFASTAPFCAACRRSQHPCSIVARTFSQCRIYRDVKAKFTDPIASMDRSVWPSRRRPIKGRSRQGWLSQRVWLSLKRECGGRESLRLLWHCHYHSIAKIIYRRLGRVEEPLHYRDAPLERPAAARCGAAQPLGGQAAGQCSGKFRRPSGGGEQRRGGERQCD